MNIQGTYKSKPARSALFSAILFAFAFSLDYKGAETGGSALQVAYLAFAALGAGAAIFQLRPSMLSTRSLLFGTLAVAVCVWGVGMSLVHSVPIAQSLRVALPFILFTLGIGVAYSALASLHPQLGRLQLANWVLLAALVSSVWMVVEALVLRDLTVGMVRYRILSPGWAAMFGLSFGVVFTRRGLNWWYVVALAGAMVLAIVSQTRSLYLAIVVCFIFLLAYSAWKYFQGSSGRQSQQGLWASAIFGVVMFLGLIISVKLNPDLIEGLRGRLFAFQSSKTNVDPTYLTRIAEAKGMLAVTGASAAQSIAGVGFGHEYVWDSQYQSELAPYVGHLRFTYPEWIAGHNTQVSIYFHAGIMGVFFMVWTLVAAVNKLCSLFKRSATTVWWDVEREVMIPVATALLCFCVLSLSGNVFGTRFGASIFGLLCGCLFFELKHPRRS